MSNYSLLGKLREVSPVNPVNPARTKLRYILVLSPERAHLRFKSGFIFWR